MDESGPQKAAEWLRTKWSNSSCSQCSTNQWDIGPPMELRGFHGGSLVIGGGGSLVPVLPITCLNCGNTLLVNAIVAGVVERDPAEGAS